MVTDDRLVCPDCGFPRVSERHNTDDLPNCCWVGYANDIVAQPRCRSMTVTKLRAELAAARTNAGYAENYSDNLRRMFDEIAKRIGYGDFETWEAFVAKFDAKLLELSVTRERVAELEAELARLRSVRNARVENCEHLTGRDGYCVYCGTER